MRIKHFCALAPCSVAFITPPVLAKNNKKIDEITVSATRAYRIYLKWQKLHRSLIMQILNSRQKEEKS